MRLRRPSYGMAQHNVPGSVSALRGIKQLTERARCVFMLGAVRMPGCAAGAPPALPCRNTPVECNVGDCPVHARAWVCEVGFDGRRTRLGTCPAAQLVTRTLEVASMQRATHPPRPRRCSLHKPRRTHELTLTVAIHDCHKVFLVERGVCEVDHQLPVGRRHDGEVVGWR